MRISKQEEFREQTKRLVKSARLLEIHENGWEIKLGPSTDKVIACKNIEGGVHYTIFSLSHEKNKKYAEVITKYRFDENILVDYIDIERFEMGNSDKEDALSLIRQVRNADYSRLFDCHGYIDGYIDGEIFDTQANNEEVIRLIFESNGFAVNYNHAKKMWYVCNNFIDTEY